MRNPSTRRNCRSALRSDNSAHYNYYTSLALAFRSNAAGESETVQVPITLPVEITSTFTTTLWGASCTTIDTPRTPGPRPSPPVSSTSDPVTPVVTTQTTTQSDGSVTTETVTSTPPPATTIASNDQDARKSNAVAPIVGGAVGGFFGLIAIVAVIWFILKRRRRWDDIFEKDDDEIFATGARRAGRASRLSLEPDTEPKPYQYGLVG
ncbi:hypothetical protein DXG03_008830 [Asterophora parasitica]|uniref:Mid2 domain-containing protein n=1 Tax=Asterophora parasitica TaxID=117018 RepID=A0A9P7KCU5_9AGAR|nr:hypothetical protein DXG03_008830 [Asterophora parasitica]